jgi:hypothetical protein
LHSHLTPIQRMVDSAECWPNTISKTSLSREGKSAATFHLSMMLGD